MYINSLGMRDVEKLHGVKKAGGIVSGSRNFSEILQKAAGSRKGEQAVSEDPQACCETCKQTSRLVKQMMVQNLYLQSGMGTAAGLSSGGLGAWRGLAGLTSGGLSSSSLGALAAYQGLTGLFSGL